MTKNNEDNSDQSSRGPGFFGGMRSQFGHYGFSRAQFGQRGWLRPAVLKLLEKKPMNGMEIINEFNNASNGWWRPSPGSIYPLLEGLENEGYIKRESNGKYTITSKFKERNTPKGQVDDMITNMEGTVSYLEELAKSDKQKFATYKKRLENLVDRISKIK